jgi:hypothetical protein
MAISLTEKPINLQVYFSSESFIKTVYINKITADAANITMSEKIVFIIIFFRFIMSHMPNMAITVNTSTRAIRM